MISTPDAAPVIAATQLRARNAGSARGAATLAAEAIATTKAVLATQSASAGEIVPRADSVFYSRMVIAAARRGGLRFSITIRVDEKLRRAIESIPASAWVEITYPHPVWDDDQQRLVSRAQIAETTYTAFDKPARPHHAQPAGASEWPKLGAHHADSVCGIASTEPAAGW
jgi:hypothetical protein